MCGGGIAAAVTQSSQGLGFYEERFVSNSLTRCQFPSKLIIDQTRFVEKNNNNNNQPDWRPVPFFSKVETSQNIKNNRQKDNLSTFTEELFVGKREF